MLPCLHTQGIRVSMGRSMPRLANTRCLTSSGHRCCCGILGTHVSHAPTRVEPQLALLVQSRAQLPVSVLTPRLIDPTLQPEGALHHLADRRPPTCHSPPTPH